MKKTLAISCIAIGIILWQTQNTTTINQSTTPLNAHKALSIAKINSKTASTHRIADLNKKNEVTEVKNKSIDSDLLRPLTDEEISQDIKLVDKKWKPYIEKAYENLALDEQQDEQILEIREKYRSIYADLHEQQKNVDGSSLYSEAFRNQSALYSSEVQQVLGSRKFSYLIKARDAFNDHLRVDPDIQSGIVVDSSW